MAWLSPAYPVGAFSYSSGIEWAVEAGDITDAGTLQRWLAAVIGNGGGFCDAAFFVHAHRAAAGNDDAALTEVAELAAAFAPSKERLLETTAQGRAFIEATQAAWPCAALDRLPTKLAKAPSPIRWRSASPPPATGSRSSPRFRHSCRAAAANLVSAGVRLVPLGQTDGQRVLAALEPVIAGCCPARTRNAARRHRRRRLPCRYRQHAARDAAHAAVSELSMGKSPHGPLRIEVGARSAPARPR